MESSIAYMADQLTVQFVEVPDKYPPNQDLVCKYTCSSYKVREGDRIAVFKLGWNSLKNYVLFEWAIDFCLPVNYVIFSKFDLPNTQETDDLYQFCYISGENVVQGISTPFQISSKSINMTDSLKNENQCTHLRQLVAAKDKEILKLKEENAILKESLRAVVEQRKSQETKCYDDDINELKNLTNSLKTLVLNQQEELQTMKLELQKSKAEMKKHVLEKLMSEKKTDVITPERKFEINPGPRDRVRRLNLDFDLGSLLPLPPFPFQSPDKL